MVNFIKILIAIVITSLALACSRSGPATGVERTEQARQHLERGLELARAGTLDQALAELDQGLALDPDWIVLHYNQAIVFSEQGDIDKEEAAYRRVIDLAPRASQQEREQFLAASYYNMVFIVLKRGDKDQAFDYLDKTLAAAAHINDYYHELVGNKDLVVLHSDRRFKPLMWRYWPNYGVIAGELPVNAIRQVPPSELPPEPPGH